MKRRLNSFSATIDITHVRTLNLGGHPISLVYYVPGGAHNSISVPQLEDHGIMTQQKHRTFILQIGDKIIARFPRRGDLYVSAFRHSLCANSISTLEIDWHIMLGHPSDIYLSKYLLLNNVSAPSSLSFFLHCEICKMCKLKSKPHMHSLPASKFPFEKLHFDLLQITPASRSSLLYVLAIIDDFSHFNWVYILQLKIEAEAKLLSYLN